MCKAEVKADDGITSTFIFRQQASLAFLMLRNCSDSSGESRFVMICYIWLRGFLCTLSAFDTGSCGHLRQNGLLFDVAWFQNLRELRKSRVAEHASTCLACPYKFRFPCYCQYVLLQTSCLFLQSGVSYLVRYDWSWKSVSRKHQELSPLMFDEGIFHEVLELWYQILALKAVMWQDLQGKWKNMLHCGWYFWHVKLFLCFLW